MRPFATILMRIALGLATLACCPSTHMLAATPCTINITTWTTAGSTTNPITPVTIVSVDHFKSSGRYEYTILGQGFAGVHSPNCALTKVVYDLDRPLAASGGDPTPADPLPGVNVGFYDDASTPRPLAEYPVAFSGTITYEATSATQASATTQLPIILVITKQIDQN
jgi:hypothetical protein